MPSKGKTPAPATTVGEDNESHSTAATEQQDTATTLRY